MPIIDENTDTVEMGLTLWRRTQKRVRELETEVTALRNVITTREHADQVCGAFPAQLTKTCALAMDEANDARSFLAEEFGLALPV